MAVQYQTIKAVFNGGEMSPIMDGRTDSEKYATGCRLLENFIVRPYGGIFKRPGTRYGVADADVTDCVRLIPFRRSTSINFVLGFKTNAIKVWSYSAGAFTLVTTLTTTYAEDDIKRIHFVQLNDVMFLTHPSYHPKRITRANDGTWAIEDVPFQFAPALDPPDDAVTLTIVYDANDWVANTSYVIGDFVLYLNELYRCKTANTDAAFTAGKWDKATYRPPWNVDQTYVAGDVVEYFGSNYFWKGASTVATTANRPGVGADWVLMSFTDYRLIASSATFDANEVGSTWLLSPGSTKRTVSETIPTSIGTRTSAAAFIQGSYLARTNWSAAGAPNKTTFQLQESLDRMNFTTIKEWFINGLQEGTISYTNDAPNTGAWYRWVSLKDDAAGGTGATMTIEPANGKLDIPFKIESYVSTTQVRGIPKLAVDSLIPNEVIGSAFPIWRKGAFSASRGYPRTVAFHDQRLWFAGTATEPMRLWGSQTDDFYTFLTGTFDTSGIDVTLAATQANDIQWIASFKRTLVIGTTGEEWTLDSGDQDNPLTPDSLRLRRWSRYGSSYHQPILAGDGLLWLTRDNRLREFAYVFEKDGYSAPEMSLLAEHIPTRSEIVNIAYSQSPDPIVWLIHADGTWSGFTYDRENNVTAWHRHISEGALCNSIATLYSASTASDSLIFLFDRSYGGAFPDVLESIDGTVMQAAMCSGDSTFTNTDLESSMIFMDCHVAVTGTHSAGNTTFPVTSQNPVFHNNGSVYVVLANRNPGTSVILNSDGSPLSVQVNVSGNAVVPGNYAGSYIAGIPFIAWVIPNRSELSLPNGTSQMKKWRVARASFRVWQSLYGNVQQRISYSGFSGTVDHSSATFIDYNGIDAFPRAPSSGLATEYTKTGQTLPQVLNFDWGNALDIVITSKHPTPFNLLGMILEIEIGDTSGAGS